MWLITDVERQNLGPVAFISFALLSSVAFRCVLATPPLPRLRRAQASEVEAYDYRCDVLIRDGHTCFLLRFSFLWKGLVIYLVLRKILADVARRF